MSGHRDPHATGPHGRTEPRLGDLGQLEGDSPRARVDDGLPSLLVEPDQRRAAPPPRAPRPRRRGWLWPLLALVLLAVLVVLWLNQGHLRSLVPRTDLDSVLHRAQVALQEGRLDGTDGTSARELFEAARALEPDNDRALEGLHEVGEAEVASADAALRAGKLDEADQALASARELLGGGSEVDRLGQAIAKARNANGQVDALIDQAQQAYAAGKLDGNDGAGPLYQRALAADSDNAVAKHGLDQVGGALAAQARKALAAGDRAAADALVGRLAALLPNYAELPSLRAAQTQLQQQSDATLATALQQGQDALRSGRVAGAGDDTALAHFKAALAIDPDNAQAKAGLGQVAAALVVQANAAIDGGDTAQATSLLDQAAALAPRSADLLAARARLGAHAPAPAPIPAGDAAVAGDRDTSPPVALDPQQKAKVAALVQRARAAAARGEIMTPPGECAYDLYRNALAIDGNDPAARAGLQGLPALVTREFGQALDGGNLGQAGNLLDALDNLSPGDASLVPLRQRLAGAWLDQAEKQLDGGNRGGAAQSLEQARKLAPNHPRVQELTARMQGGA
ncbi:tetratricopeptide repeat protein [Fulvimonas sp. R45]|uniref:tetratricopeptide repeat protein n=1 Tax=Fulvimonas sp. R45 TaxID=3045937 RepID=UPI0026600EE2|nr:tetratricopeptide repeat protein [Fulvimonas sp. R45]MDO1528109.1 tetratricopeptide repeat protein [Fulvimonas sp. R45]